MMKPGLNEVKEFTKRWVELDFEHGQSKKHWDSGIRKSEISVPATNRILSSESWFLYQ